MPHEEAFKTRTIALRVNDDVATAAAVLNALEGVSARALPDRPAILLSYTLPEHTLADLVGQLVASGFHPIDGPLEKLRLALIAYGEDVQRHNFDAPVIAVKPRDAFSRIYQHHPHGDADETTPEESRHYR
ncbi:hypothetical protein [Crenobacter cavernae]|uniref:Uncharacterized protein n=1 Tax=Crenobacter cavernae TaxID=2290923 RepID=A0ABY0FJN1_9NEIS|nr:hypothetical protein [Crenobacter cavernae]RXZ45658.1 hypothetical protein EBB06_02280 [Crenobacter cavernae]